MKSTPSSSNNNKNSKLSNRPSRSNCLKNWGCSDCPILFISSPSSSCRPFSALFAAAAPPPLRCPLPPTSPSTPRIPAPTIGPPPPLPSLLNSYLAAAAASKPGCTFPYPTKIGSRSCLAWSSRTSAPQSCHTALQLATRFGTFRSNLLSRL